MNDKKFTSPHILIKSKQTHLLNFPIFSQNECHTLIILSTLPHHLRWAFWDTFIILTKYQYFHNKSPIRDNQHSCFSAKFVTFTVDRSGIASTFNPGTKPTVKTMPCSSMYPPTSSSETPQKSPHLTYINNLKKKKKKKTQSKIIILLWQLLPKMTIYQ